MLAGHIIERGRIELVDIDEPAFPSADAGTGPQVLFQPQVACLCGSDVPFFDSAHTKYPQPVGYSLHEMVGVVAATNGARFRPGDRVLTVPVGQRGFYARYVVVESRAIPLDPRKPPEQALLAQPLGTVIFGLKKLPSLLDKDVAVVGQGPIGQMFCACLRNLGARQIVAIDRLKARLELSHRMGATAVVHLGPENAVDAVRDLTDGRGADVVIEAVGHDELALNLCIELCAKYGRILSFGVPPEKAGDLRWREAFFNNLTFHTSVDPDFARDFPLAMQWIGEGRIDLSPLLTHRFPVEQVQTAFETFRDRRDGAIKVLLDFPR